MITPITELAEKTAFLTKFTQIFGNTLDYDQNIDGDWTQMKTKKWQMSVFRIFQFIIMLIMQFVMKSNTVSQIIYKVQ